MLPSTAQAELQDPPTLKGRPVKHTRNYGAWNEHAKLHSTEHTSSLAARRQDPPRLHVAGTALGSCGPEWQPGLG